MRNYYNWIGINEEEIEAYEAECEQDLASPEDFESSAEYAEWWKWYCSRHPSTKFGKD